MMIELNKDSTIWWKNRFGYEIYPRTFKDSNGDGIGDLKGIESELDYLQNLGISTIWICPFYKSPGIDCGYDVSDYYSIDPEIGTMEDFDSLIQQAHKRDIAVLIDIVPNHSSDQHELFQQALNDPNSAEREMYIFRDPSPNGGPPNNWLSVFGGSAWELDERSGQYYLHLFYPEQPDFNWRNPLVHKMFEDILRFWYNKGIDGFRIDVTQGLYKHPDLPDARLIDKIPVDAGGEERFTHMDNEYYYCLPETPLVFENWKKISREYNGVLIGEMAETTPERLANYFSGNGLDMVTYLTITRTDWDPEKLVEIFAFGENNFFGKIVWMMSNHDWKRTVSRFGGNKVALQRALTTSSFTACISGMPFLYYGEELGLNNCEVRQEHFRDPRGLRDKNSVKESRDPYRTNMTWDHRLKNHGFSQADELWLISKPREDNDCVSLQIDDPTSAYSHYKKIIGLRKELADIANMKENKEWIHEDRFIGYVCADYFVGMNVDSIDRSYAVDGQWELIYSSGLNNKIKSVLASMLEFPSESTCVYRRL